mmetsp:Transcript_30832/g.63864  ORF Transcript_30832/g.63864 Transcript_30832/m.63864 type:complete len:104 (+) Transcript_30832:1040-1351(+)
MRSFCISALSAIAFFLISFSLLCLAASRALTCMIVRFRRLQLLQIGRERRGGGATTGGGGASFKVSERDIEHACRGDGCGRVWVTKPLLYLDNLHVRSQRSPC